VKIRTGLRVKSTTMPPATHSTSAIAHHATPFARLRVRANGARGVSRSIAVTDRPIARILRESHGDSTRDAGTCSTGGSSAHQTMRAPAAASRAKKCRSSPCMKRPSNQVGSRSRSAASNSTLPVKAHGRVLPVARSGRAKKRPSTAQDGGVHDSGAL